MGSFYIINRWEIIQRSGLDRRKVLEFASKNAKSNALVGKRNKVLRGRETLVMVWSLGVNIKSVPSKRNSRICASPAMDQCRPYSQQ